MDLLPRRNRKKVPGLHYNWAGWIGLCTLLDKCGGDTSEFYRWNIGERSSAKTCDVVVEVIREHYADLSKDGAEWIEGHEEGWRALAKAGGCEQW